MSQEKRVMNCEDYKSALTEDPAFDGGKDHLTACADCQTFRGEFRELNDKIARALEINVPELQFPELPDLAAENVTVLAAMEGRRAVSKPTWLAGLAIAATIALAAFIGVRFSAVDVAEGSIADQVLAHLDHEAYSLRSTKPVSPERLARVVPANIATIDNDEGLITYAQSCEINGNDAPHLVLQGKKGPITIILMPDEAVSQELPINGESIYGKVIPNGGGSIAIIGEKDEQLDQVIQSLKESVTWST